MPGGNDEGGLAENRRGEGRTGYCADEDPGHDAWIRKEKES